MAGQSNVRDRLSRDGVITGSNFRIIGRKIGAGNFGVVQMGVNTATGQKVAVKIERIANMKGVRKVPEREIERDYKSLLWSFIV